MGIWLQLWASIRTNMCRALIVGCELPAESGTGSISELFVPLHEQLFLRIQSAPFASHRSRRFLSFSVTD